MCDCAKLAYVCTLELTKNCCEVNSVELIGFEPMNEAKLKQTVDILTISSTQMAAEGSARSVVHNVARFPPELQNAKPKDCIDKAGLWQV